MNVNYIIYAIPVFLFMILLEVLADYFTKKGTYRLNDAITNLGIGIGEQVISVFTRAFMLMLYDWVYQFRFVTLDSNVFTGIALLLLFEFIFYWAHRFGHEVNVGWAGHIVHHSSEEYNLTVALRQPWFFNLMTFAMFLPIALLGFSPKLLVIISAIDVLYQFWIHTRFIGKLGPLELVLNTPSHHRVHHGRNPEYLDKNYGGMLIIYDRLFGTFKEEKEEVVYGITNPVSSWNPAWANLHYFAELIRLNQKAYSFTSKLLVWLKPPGYSPENGGYMQKIKSVNTATYHRFDINYPSFLNYYVLVQFITSILFTIWYLSNSKSDLTQLQNILSASYLLFAVSMHGLLFENRRNLYFAELVRLVLFSIVCMVCELNMYIILFALAFSLVSFAYLLYKLLKK